MKYTKRKWYPVLYCDGWCLQIGPNYGDLNILTSDEYEGYADEKETENNATLASKSGEMFEALKWLIVNQNEDNLTISSTAMNANYEDVVINDKLLEIESLLKEIENDVSI